MASEKSGRVAGKVVLVTGGARGQGASHGRVLAGEGAKVLLADVRDQEGEATASRLRDEGFDVQYTHLDVASMADWDAAVALAERTFGKLNVVVNNAGITGNRSNVRDCTMDEWNSVVAVNQTGVFLGIQRSIPALERAGGGSIINIVSVLATLGTDFSIAYAASKGAVHMLTRAASVMLAPTIRVNSVTPGIVESEMSSDMERQNFKLRTAAYPMGRAGRAHEVSQAVLFLASDEASFTTGTDIRVDGGAISGVKNRNPT